MRESTERDLAVADELGRMADARIKELEAENTALREQLAQSQVENERLASQLKEWQEEKDAKGGYL